MSAPFPGPGFYCLLGGTRTVIDGPTATAEQARGVIDVNSITRDAYEVQYIDASTSTLYEFLPDRGNSKVPEHMRPRQDQDGTAYLTYFTQHPIMASFAWSGDPDQPIEVAYAEAGEPVDARFMYDGDLTGSLLNLLAEFQRQCNAHLAHKSEED